MLHDRLLACSSRIPPHPQRRGGDDAGRQQLRPLHPGRLGKEFGKGGGGAARSLCDLRIGRREPGEPAAAKLPRPAQAAERPLRGGELLAILEVPAVLRRFELDDDEFNQLRRWVQETGIRWGLDDGYPERFALPRLSGNSWLFGLRACCWVLPWGREPVAGICPMRTSRAAGALGKLAWFVDSLAEFCPGCNRRSRWPNGTPACWRCWSASISPTG